MAEGMLTRIRERKEAKNSQKYEEINKEVLISADKPKKNEQRRHVLPQKK